VTDLPPGASPVDAIAPGARLREWEIVRFVGRGSYGVVFEARRSSWLDEHHRALKIFDPIISSAARSALLGEFSTLTEVRHPHLLSGIDAFDLVEPPFAGCVVFVLELADEDLAHRVARTVRLAPPEAAAVGADVAEGLDALHRRGRIHGDVKPENILRVGDRWALGDFGVTSVLEGSYAVTRGATIDYRPPELAQAAEGSRQHRSADIWALGVSLHVAATGRHPFPGPDPMMRYAAAVRGDRAVVPDLDPRFAAVIDEGCLVADPHRRLDAALLVRRLRAIAPGGVAPDVVAANAVAPGDVARVERPSRQPSPSRSPQPQPPPALPFPARPPGRAHGPARLRPWLGPAVAAVVTFLMTQAVAVLAGAVLAQVGTRQVAYLGVSLAVLVTGLALVARRLPGRSPGMVRIVVASAATWTVSTVGLFA
jgi:eukaryotic-like serine/threonine-protein kinase